MNYRLEHKKSKLAMLETWDEKFNLIWQWIKDGQLSRNETKSLLKDHNDNLSKTRES